MRSKTIVTSCPHCFHQMGNEFPQLGGNYEVIHHSTYIERLLAGRSRSAADTDEGKQLTVAYHDSCYLGRYNDVYEAPRETLRRALPVVELVEPKRTKDRGLCCGAGGGRMFMEEREGKRINVERTEELLATGAETIAVACPFCMTMISDGVNAVRVGRAGARYLRSRRGANGALAGHCVTVCAVTFHADRRASRHQSSADARARMARDGESSFGRRRRSHSG